MAQVTGVTAERANQIFNSTVVSGQITDDGHLVLSQRGGATIDAGVVSTFNQVWPVGSIFMAISPANPSTLLGGGVWESFGAGRMPISIDPNDPDFATPSLTGGEKTHKLATAELPKHSHKAPSHNHTINHNHASTTTSSDNHNHQFGGQYASNTNDDGSAIRVDDIGNKTGGGGASFTVTTASDSHSHAVNLPSYAGDSGAGGGTATSDVGSDTPHNNMPPYITCYMWKRTA